MYDLCNCHHAMAPLPLTLDVRSAIRSQDALHGCTVAFIDHDIVCRNAELRTKLYRKKKKKKQQIYFIFDNSI